MSLKGLDLKKVEVHRIRSKHEFKMAEMRAANTEQDMEPDKDGGQGDHRRNGSRATAIKALKLPPFNEDKDDLDAYLIRFERACEVRPEHWSTQLARLLQGKSLEVYQRLPVSDVERYDVLKAQLLKRFRLTEGDYGKKFKNSKLEQGETPDQFVERLRRYLINGVRWRVIRVPTRTWRI